MAGDLLLPSPRPNKPFSGVRIDSTNADPAALETGSFTRCNSRDCAFDQPRFYPCDRVDQANARDRMTRRLP
jgi:hypothetical protein